VGSFCRNCRQYGSYPLTQRMFDIILTPMIDSYHEHVITSMSKSLLEAIDDFRCSNRSRRVPKPFVA
jgi:hypothetical protein